MLNMPLAHKRRIKGMTLLEVIIVLGIMGVIAAGVVILAQRAIDSQNITKLSQAMNTLQTAMIQSFRGKANYPSTGTSQANAEQLGNALVSMGRASAEDFINPFTGDKLHIYSFSANGTADKAFYIRISSLTQEQCRSLIANAADLFSFIQVVATGGAAVTDIVTTANATGTTGVIKSPGGGGEQFDTTDLTHITALCGGDAGATQSYDVLFGSR